MKRIAIVIKDFMLIVKAEFIRDLIFMRRYPLEILSFFFFMYLILMAMILGVSQLLPKSSGNPLNQELMILGYCLMQFVLAAQMGWSGQIQNESQTGTLEQLSISGHTLGGVLLSRGIAQMPRHMLNFIMFLAVYKLSLPSAKIQLSNVYLAVPILFVTAFGVFGIAYVFAGITLLYKRVGFFFQLINFGFLGLFWQNRATIAEGTWTARIYDIFPLTVGMANLRSALIEPAKQDGYLLTTGPLYLVLVCLASTALGYGAFYLMEKRARKMALLSQY